MLEQQGKLAMMAGALIELAHLPLFLERYRRDLADGAPVIFYVENLGQSLYTELDGMTLQLQAHDLPLRAAPHAGALAGADDDGDLVFQTHGVPHCGKSYSY